MANQAVGSIPLLGPAYLGSKAIVDNLNSAAPPGPNERRGTLAPVIRNEQTGGLRLAWPQMAVDAASGFTLPGDVASGKTPLDPRLSWKNQDPATLDRAANLASMVASDGSLASRGMVKAAPEAAATVAKGAAVPTVADLEAAKNAAYKAVDDMGVVYSPQGYDKLVNDLQEAAQAGYISPDIHKGPIAVLNVMGKKPAGYAPTLTELDQLRQYAKENAFSTVGESRFGKQIVNGIDNFIENAGPADLAAGAGPEASQAITQARVANTILRKTQTVKSLIANAELQAGSTNSGGNINNALRQQFKTLLKQDERGISEAVKQGFSPEEIKQMQSLVLGGTKENAMRFLGNLLKPNLLNAIPYSMAIPAFPAAGVLPVAGQTMKHFADTGAIGKANAIADMIASTGKPAALPLPVTLSPWALGNKAAFPAVNNMVMNKNRR